MKHCYLLVVVLFSLLIACVGPRKADALVLKLQESIAKELPPGTDQATVARFLQREHIEHSEYKDANGNPEAIKLFGAPGRIDGIVRNVESGLLSSSSVRLVFLFDSHGRLMSADVRKVVTGS